MKRFPAGLLSGLAIVLILSGCATATYTTPGAGVNLANLAKADEDIQKLMTLEAASPFPARLAIARIQASGYYSYESTCHGVGKYCVVTNRDIETDEDLTTLAELPMIAGIALMNKLILPQRFTNIKNLRTTAARLKTDLLLVYSVDTVFRIENTDIGPLSLISLGFLPNKKAYVTTTASAALYDVRTGFLYGVAEASARDTHRATFWSTEEAVENSRMQTESEAFDKLLGEFGKLWKGVVEQ